MARNIKQVLVVTVLALSSTSVGASPDRQHHDGRDLRCLSGEHHSCGCSLKVVTLFCSDPNEAEDSGWHAHFFSELNEGAPLWLNLAGREFSLASRLPPDDTFRHKEGDSWQEAYEGEGLKVHIQYRPGKSTCPAEKEQDEDGCEYFDVIADVAITAGDGPSIKYRALGACGC